MKSPGSAATERFSGDAAAAVRAEVELCSGNEVFFLGRTDESGLVREVQALARGNDEAVPVVMDVALAGDVVIHNHPGGILVPSEPDLDIAGRIGALGVGFYIVDNLVERVYAVVEPRRAGQAVEPLDPDKVASIFDEGGELSAAHINYEVRPSQCRMAADVTSVLEEAGLGLFEAGTGTGKSLAYLVPSIMWALRGKRRVVVATRTINLQEQLLKQDLPLAEEVLGMPFKAVLVKGRGNYLCMRKRDLLEGESSEILLELEDLNETRQLLAWSAATRDGTLADISFVPRESNWELFRSESDSCTRARCRHFSRCFFYRSRLEAASAQILLANHHILFADLGLRAEGSDAAAIMPRYDAVILDEAHNVEDVALSYFDGSVGRWGLVSLFGRLVSRRRPDRGLVPFLEAVAGRSRTLGERRRTEVAALCHGLSEAVLSARGRTDAIFDALAERFTAWLGRRGVQGAGSRRKGLEKPDGQDGRSETRWRIPAERREEPQWEGILDLVRELVELLGEVQTPLRKLNRKIRELAEDGQEELEGFWGDLGAVSSRIEASREFLRTAAEGPGDDQVFWVEARPGSRRPSLNLHLTPLDASSILQSTLYSGDGPVIMTSATLTVGGDFGFITERLGLGEALERPLIKAIYPTTFDLARQMRLAVLDDMPDPGQNGFAASLTGAVDRLVKASGGGALVLFTSYRTMDEVFEGVSPGGRHGEVRFLRQGEAPRTALLEEFRSDPNSVLFATDSFWEGVDVVGSSLRNLIIARLPFPVPTDPLNEARSEAMMRDGRDPFLEDSVPRAVIRLRQGIGRLIRHRNDRGVAVICDTRLLRRPYGRIFLASLPEIEPEIGGTVEIARRVREFLGR